MSGASKSIVNTPEQQFVPQSGTLKSIAVLAGNYDPTKTSVVENVFQQVVNAADVGARFGLGSELHRMALYFEQSSNKEVELQAFPLTAPTGGTAQENTITFATDATSSGSWYFRIGSYLLSDIIQVNVAVDDTPTAQASALASAITAKGNLPFTATAALGVVTIVAKTASISAKDYQITNNVGSGESDLIPAGTTVTIASTVTGAGESDLTSLWGALADESSSWKTDVVTPYDSLTALNGALVACGNPNLKTGLYGAPVYNPFTNWTTGNTGGLAALTTAIALGDSRKETDPCNARLEAPSSPEIGFEISAYIMGGIAKQAQENAAKAFTALQFPLLFGPLTSADDWTTQSANRDLAVDAGITPVAFLTGTAKCFDVCSFWHPTTSELNAPFKFIVNQRKIWNVANAVKTYEQSAAIQDRPTVEDVSATDFTANAIDTDTVLADLSVLADQWSQKAWIYTSTFTIVNTTVTEDPENPDRFIIYIPIITSGNLRQKEADVAVTRDIAAVNVVIGG